MRTDIVGPLVLLTVLGITLTAPGTARAQGADTIGTRAQGMGGAFVGIADDASAVYWNPAGLAKGSYFSLLIDGTTGESIPDGETRGGERTGWLLALGTPALGLSYYRLQNDAVTPSNGSAGRFRLNTLVTHHVGATLVQSITDFLSVGATVKMVRGTAGTGLVDGVSPEDVLDNWDVLAASDSNFDVDIGVMAVGSMGRVGLLIRNVTEPDFDTGAGTELALERQIRVGGSVLLLRDWVAALDADFTTRRGVHGEVRELAVGTEGRVSRRFTTRAGVRLNTAGDRGTMPGVSVGGSFAVMSSVLVDGQVTGGSELAFKGWGLAARVVF